MPLIPKKKAIENIQELKTEFINLGWKILYHKCLYYEFGHDTKYNFLRISDDSFDAMEKRYEKVAKILNCKPTASEQVGFDPKTGSGSLVLSRVLLDHYQSKHSKKSARAINTNDVSAKNKPK